MRYSLLLALLRCVFVLLVLRVLVTILLNYPDYFPPNFDSLFLEGREATFHGLYRVAFYIHIFVGPIVLLNGLMLLSETIRKRCGNLHRMLGRVQVVVLVCLLLPSSLVMSQHAFGGWLAGLSFALLSLLTGLCAILGVKYARERKFAQHRRWMLRTFILLSSAVVLRLISGMLDSMKVSHPEIAYIVASWCSWLIPLLVFETAGSVKITQYFKTTNF